VRFDALEPRVVGFDALEPRVHLRICSRTSSSRQSSWGAGSSSAVPLSVRAMLLLPSMLALLAPKALSLSAWRTRGG
jgi:hypothetical protein